MEEIKKQILDLANSWAEAEQKGDIEFLKNVLSGDFVGIGPLGFTLSKDQWVQRHVSGQLKYRSLQLAETQARIFGDAAILIAKQLQSAEYQGNNVDAQFRVSLVFVKSGENWQIANLQLSAIGQAPSFSRKN